jgi:hypothetical protein
VAVAFSALAAIGSFAPISSVIPSCPDLKDAFAVLSPAPQAFGNAGVGIMRGPGLASFDLSVAKKVLLDDSRYVQFRTEFFNAFNHANFGPPDIRREASTFGRILTAGSGRIVQFGLKLYF